MPGMKLSRRAFLLGGGCLGLLAGTGIRPRLRALAPTRHRYDATLPLTGSPYTGASAPCRDLDRLEPEERWAELAHFHLSPPERDRVLLGV